jgi:sarcosine oxidase
MNHYDVIVLGAGGVGSAAVFHVAKRGARVLGIDRFGPGHDRGSSHGQTRLIRQAYYEHPNYVPLVRRAFELWNELEQLSSQVLYHQVGLLQIGPPNGEVLSGVRASAALHSLDIEPLSARQSEARFPGFRVPVDCEAIYERRAGYLMVERCVEAHAAEAIRLGACLQSGEAIRSWRAEAEGVVVETDRDSY